MSTTALAEKTSKPSALVAMAQRFSVEPEKLLNTLKGTVFKNATNEQLMALVVVSNEYGLNPFTKQIYAFPDKGGGIVPVVSIDGWLHMMQEHPQFDGIEFEFARTGDKPESCTATIYRKDRSKPTRVTEYFSECYRNTDPWNKSPSRMLRHRATIQCIRVAFGFSVSDPEDAERMLERDITPAAAVVAPPRLFTAPAPTNVPAVPETQPEVVGASTGEPESGGDTPVEPSDIDPLTEITRRLNAEGIDDSEYLAFLVKSKMAKPEQDFSDIAISKHGKILENWDAFMAAVRPKKGGAA